MFVSLYSGRLFIYKMFLSHKLHILPTLLQVRNEIDSVSPIFPWGFSEMSFRVFLLISYYLPSKFIIIPLKAFRFFALKCIYFSYHSRTNSTIMKRQALNSNMNIMVDCCFNGNSNFIVVRLCCWVSHLFNV